MYRYFIVYNCIHIYYMYIYIYRIFVHSVSFVGTPGLRYTRDQFKKKKKKGKSGNPFARRALAFIPLLSVCLCTCVYIYMFIMSEVFLRICFCQNGACNLQAPRFQYVRALEEFARERYSRSGYAPEGFTRRLPLYTPAKVQVLKRQ